MKNREPTILDEIAEKTRGRVEGAKKLAPPDKVQEEALALAGKDVPMGQNPVLPFEGALRQEGLSFICEVKKASPSKGIISEDFPWLTIAQEYEAAGAAALSVLTEPDYFLGSDLYLSEIAAAAQIPCLRKDFTVDPYQIYEAKILGAQAVLLICALLDGPTLRSYIQIARDLNLSALVEIHDQDEAESALAAGAGIIGINNRNLKTFQVDMEAGARLRSSIPPGVLVISESGVQGPEDTRILRDLGFDGVLIGESLMRAPDKKKFLHNLMVLGG
ncbi:MAG: indole-3-glycerol phosphate synthase TrpC [Treponema sp.]|nr:indole-3-glycerol phosphate synthase TrpC [Treponema sp.]